MRGARVAASVLAAAAIAGCSDDSKLVVCDSSWGPLASTDHVKCEPACRTKPSLGGSPCTVNGQTCDSTLDEATGTMGCCFQVSDGANRLKVAFVPCD